MGEIILDVLLETGVDVLRMLPFLFLSYLLIELMEKKAGEQTMRFMDRSGKWGPAIGAVAGMLPQCGLSSAASGLYAGGIITCGTLLAVFLSTSDEMLPIMISSHASIPFLLEVLLGKALCGMVAGFLLDSFLSRRGRENKVRLGEFCEREQCGCEEGGILRPALIHTAKILAFVFAASLAVNLLVEFMGAERLGGFLFNRPVIGEILAGVLGLIPGCAGSVLITELYLSGGMRIGAMLAGLFVCSGSGLLVLFRTNHHLGDNLRLLVLLYVSGVLLGIFLGLVPIWA